MLTYFQALDLIQSHAKLGNSPDASVETLDRSELRQLRHPQHPRQESERVALVCSIGRVCAEDLVSQQNVPSFDTSAMDGYAVRSSETSAASESAPLQLRVLGSLAAGSELAPDHSSTETEGVAWEIMTGAAFPKGFDACVRLEDVQPLGGSHQSGSGPRSICLIAPVKPNQNRRLAGEDFQAASAVLPRGHVVREEDILCLASLGITELSVKCKLRVAVIATGQELVAHDQIPKGHQIRNSTTPYLLAALHARGVNPVHLGTVGDDPTQFRSLIEKARDAKYDLVLTTGAISVGKWDYVAETLRVMGLETYFQKVAIRPGKPILFGRLPWGPLLLGLPGNPVATATGMRFFVDPLLDALEGRPPEKPRRARLVKSTRKAPGPTCFLKARLSMGDGGFEVFAHQDQKASMTRPLLSCNAWIRLDAGQPEELSAGCQVDAYPYLPEHISQHNSRAPDAAATLRARDE